MDAVNSNKCQKANLVIACCKFCRKLLCDTLSLDFYWLLQTITKVYRNLRHASLIFPNLTDIPEFETAIMAQI